MTNPLIPGITAAEQDVLYQKLNEYNLKKASFKEGRRLSCGIAKSRLSPIFTLDLLPSARKAIHILHIRPERGYTRSLTNGKHLMLLLPPSSVVSGV